MKKYILYLPLFFFLTQASASNLSEVNFEELDLSLSKIRKQFPLKDTIFGNLDEKIYVRDANTGKKKYRTSEEIKYALSNLIQLAKPSGKIIRVEHCAIAHLGKAALSFFQGKKGLAKDWSRGLELFTYYIEYGYSSDRTSYLAVLRGFKKKESADELIERLKEVREEKLKKIQQERIESQNFYRYEPSIFTAFSMMKF